MPNNSSSNSRVITSTLRLVAGLFGLSLMLAFPPATVAAEFTVTSNADSGPGTLRQAILDASSGDTINFSLPGKNVIALTSGQLEVNKSLTINGPGVDLLEVQGNQVSFRVLFFGEGFTSSISGLKIMYGNANGSQGGGLLNRGTLNITDCLITANAAGSGGGLYNSGTMALTNSTIAANSAGSGGGGGVFSSGQLTINGSTLVANLAQTTGGAIFNGPNVIYMRLTNTTISGNSTFNNSSAGSSVGGAVYTQGNVSMENCTVTANTSSTGGGLYISPGANPEVQVRSSIIAKNTAIFSGPDVSGENITSVGHILIGNNSGATISSATGDQIGTAASPIDPLLGPLQDNGGPTLTHALLSGSPAIDRGLSGGSNTDQRGLARPVDSPAIENAASGNGSDLGAYEVQADLLPGCNTVNLVVNNNNDSGAGSLRDVIANACAGSTITFAPNVRGAITLTSGQLQITKSLNLNGPGANLLAVRRSTAPGTPLFRIFLNTKPDPLTTPISTISGLTIANGHAGNDSAGGILNLATLTLTNCAVSNNNSSGGNGGGVRNGGTMTVINTTITGNSGVGGGGGLSSNGTAAVINSTISGNSDVLGGGIYGGGISLTITSSTIAGNLAGSGGGLSAAPGTQVKLRNTIIAQNTAPTGPNIGGGAVTSQGFNLIGDNSGATISSAQFTDLIGTSGSPVDPLLGPLQDNGGPTLTRALLSGSPALDRGHSGGLNTDQRGLQRPFDLPDANAAGGDAADIGAFEAQVNCSYVINPTVQPFPAGGGANSVNVTAPVGCAWTASSNSPFISITSGASGSGGGAVGYTVAANPDAGQRSGVMIVAGQTFVVGQAGTASAASTIQFSQPGYTTSEGAGSMTVTVTRTGELNSPATVEYATTDGTATDRGDYNTTVGRLRFAAGENSKAFGILITDDAYAEGTESFNLTLANPTGGAALGSTFSAAVTISDNDASTSAANPLDATAFFVRQQYVDFFSREPDAPGLSFWAGGIDSCGANAVCREVRRIDTSAAFFLSIEFQETGFLVHRLYRASFGRLSRYREFVRDTQEIGRGVVVNSPGWEAQLEANKAAFLSDFAARADFQARYGGMANAQYVDALNANTGGSLSQGERDSLVAGLNGGTETRATALRKAADDPDFRGRETSPAFVLMQYFGYLRRNPDDPPDAGFAGYDFWLGKLVEFGGDYRRAEMVRAFLVSTEYRRRFGQ